MRMKIKLDALQAVIIQPHPTENAVQFGVELAGTIIRSINLPRQRAEDVLVALTLTLDELAERPKARA